LLSSIADGREVLLYSHLKKIQLDISIGLDFLAVINSVKDKSQKENMQSTNDALRISDFVRKQ